MSEWIPVKTRSLTEEEKKEMPFCDFLYDCPLPEPGQKVLITTNNGYVTTDTLYMDEYGDYYFEVFCNADEVVAWMPIPEPYKEVSKYDEQIISHMPEKKSKAERQDIMIRATKSMGVTKDKLFEVFYSKGISGVFNFGLEAMYRYLYGNEEN